MTGDEYMALLVERQEDHMREHPPARPWLKPLLDWFIRPGDEDVFTPPAVEPQPKRVTTPRTYRSAASLRDERDRLTAQAAPLVTPLLNDRAAAGGQALGQKGTARIQKREDARLQRYVALDRRIRALDARIASAEARERRAAS